MRVKERLGGRWVAKKKSGREDEVLSQPQRGRVGDGQRRVERKLRHIRTK